MRLPGTMIWILAEDDGLDAVEGGQGQSAQDLLLRWVYGLVPAQRRDFIQQVEALMLFDR